jgi:hypothetical protein
MVVDDKLVALREAKAANEQLIHVEHVLGLTRSDLESLLCVPANRLDTPQTWPRQSHMSLVRLAAIANHLEDTFEPASIETWLHAPSRDLHWRIPLDLLRDRQFDSIDAALEAIDSGVYV